MKPTIPFSTRIGLASHRFRAGGSCSPCGGFARVRKSPVNAGACSEKGFTNLEMLLVFLIVVFSIGTLIPAFLASNRKAAEREVGIRLAVIQQAKRDVMKEMNLILPREARLRITDRVNPLHVDKITRLTLESPWRFQPDDPDPLGGRLFIGETFLEPPSSSLGIPIADLGELIAELSVDEATP